MSAGLFRNRFHCDRCPAALVVTVVVSLGGLGLAGCAPNEPFDPASVPNSAPLVRITAVPAAPDGELAPGSYYRQPFGWSGTDRDGWVVEYHVRLSAPATADGPWRSTTETDTVVTFVTDEAGWTDALLQVVCIDDRGALSDTASQYYRIRNFPPDLVYQGDFKPLANMQREVSAASDTTYWNFGVCNFRYRVFDANGGDTLEPFYRYTLFDGEPDVTWDAGDPGADPETGWVRVPLSGGEIREFEVWLQNVRPGNRTLTVSVRDESLSDSRLQFSWEVRAPRGPVLWVLDNSSSLARTFTRETLDAAYGPDGWDTFEFIYSFPDRASVLLETLRQFDAVMWTGGSTTSQGLKDAAVPGGVIQQYVMPNVGSTAAPGHLLIVSRAITGATSGLSPAFRQAVLKVSPTGAPAAELSSFSGLQVLGVVGSLPPFTCTSSFTRAIGLAPLDGCEWLYRFEECCERGCFGSGRGAPSPCDPVAATRWPLRSSDPEARVIAVGIEPEYFDRAQAIAAFTSLLTVEMGVAAP